MHTPGRFVWRELATPDLGRARRFYGELLGWTFEESAMPGGVYVVASQRGTRVAGMWTPPAATGIPPSWSSYVSVTDVDGVTAHARRLGWTVAREPEDIPRVGRFSVLLDFGGAAFMAFRDAEGDAAPALPGPGTFCWETLVTSDVPRALREYGEVLGWTTRPGPGGAVPLFQVDATEMGAVADVQESAGRPPTWLTYVVAEHAEASRDRAATLGGTVVVPRIEIPTVGIIAFVADPAGAVLGLFQPAAG